MCVSQFVDLALANPAGQLFEDDSGFVHHMAFAVKEQGHADQKEKEDAKIDIPHVGGLGADVDYRQQGGAGDSGYRADYENPQKLTFGLLPYTLEQIGGFGRRA
jgi:hypothetical protein